MLSVSFNHSGNEIFSGDSNGVLKVWDPRSATEIKSLSAHQGPVRAIAASKDSTIATAGKDGLVVWDVKSGTEVLPIPDAGDVLTAEFSSDGRVLISQRVNGTFEVWDSKTGEALMQHRTTFRQ